MAKTSFSDIENEPSTQVAVLEPENRAVAVSRPLGASIEDASKGLVGDWTTDDTKLPRLNIVGRTGELPNEFTQGCIVLEKTHELTTVTKDTGSPLRVVALRMLKQYQENIPFDDQQAGVQARIFNSAMEVRASGGQLSFSKGENKFSELAHIEFLILAPEGISEDALGLFYNTTDEGKAYARAVMTVGGTAFGAVAGPLASSLRGHLAELGLFGGYWDLGTKIKKNDKFSWWAPTIRAAGLVEEDTANLIATLV